MKKPSRKPREDEFESCPFCGSSEVSVSEGIRKAEYPSTTELPFYYVECHNCAAMGPQDDWEKEKAIINWNTRDI